MRGFLLVLVAVLFSSDLFAKIPNGCQPNLDEIVSDRQEFESRVETSLSNGELTSEEITHYRTSHESLARVVALLCSGLRRIELERSFFGKLGLVSRKKAERESQDSYDAALEYYNNNTPNH